MAQLVKNPSVLQETLVQFLGWKDPQRRDRLPIPVFLGFPSGSAGKESACIVGDLGLIPGLGQSPGEGKGYPLQYPGLENSMDCIKGVAKSWVVGVLYIFWKLTSYKIDGFLPSFFPCWYTVPIVYFCFFCLCFWCCTWEIIVKTNYWLSPMLI